MKRFKAKGKVFIAATAMLFAGSASAAVSPEEAKQLGTTLTPWGAEKAGNKDGSIPAYTGERPKPPANYDPKDPTNMPDPYAGEKPLYTITAQNADKHADTLTDGQKEMFKVYPDFRMDIYPTHRVASYDPQRIENTLKNATACKTRNNGLALDGCYGGFPFPIPKTGNEVIWNHLLGFPAHAWTTPVKLVLVEPSGKQLLQVRYAVLQEAPFLAPGNKSVLASKSLYWRLRFDAVEPSRRAGEKTIILDSLDMIDPGRRVWTYIPGQRRVKLAPDLAYDTPNPGSGGASTMDENGMFKGAQDRYDFKLIGKKEAYILYNTYKVLDKHGCPSEVALTKHFLNPDCARYEKHRVWVVEATLKPGFRHVLPRRKFYFDEDLTGAGTSDSWDAGGNYYRMDNSFNAPFYYLPYGQAGSDISFTYDLQTGIHYTAAVVNFEGGKYGPVPPVKDLVFSPEALAGEGIR